MPALLLDTCQPHPAYRPTSGNTSSSRTAPLHHSSHFEMESSPLYATPNLLAHRFTVFSPNEVGVTRRAKVPVRPTLRGLDVLRERSKERALARELLRNRAGQMSPVSVSLSLCLCLCLCLRISPSFTSHAFPKLSYHVNTSFPPRRMPALRHSAKRVPQCRRRFRV